MAEPKLLFVDVENSPLKSLTWTRYKIDSVAKVQKESELLSVAWKWAGKKVEYLDARNESDDIVVTGRCAQLLDEADVVVAHNAPFDFTKMQGRIVYHQYPPPSDFKLVDTLRVSRSQFAFSSHKLDDVCDHLGLGRKARHPGIPMWEKCMDREPDAPWDTMKRYNKHDVVLLEKLYYRILPYMKNHPNMALLTDRPDACPMCGKTGKVWIHGTRYNCVTKRQRYRCGFCNSTFAGREIEKSDVLYVP